MVDRQHVLPRRGPRQRDGHVAEAAHAQGRQHPVLGRVPRGSVVLQARAARTIGPRPALVLAVLDYLAFAEKDARPWRESLSAWASLHGLTAEAETAVALEVSRSSLVGPEAA